MKAHAEWTGLVEAELGAGDEGRAVWIPVPEIADGALAVDAAVEAEPGDGCDKPHGSTCVTRSNLGERCNRGVSAQGERATIRDRERDDLRQAGEDEFGRACRQHGPGLAEQTQINLAVRRRLAGGPRRFWQGSGVGPNTPHG